MNCYKKCARCFYDKLGSILSLDARLDANIRLAFSTYQPKIFGGRNFRGTKFSRLGVRSRKSRKFLPRENFPLYGIIVRLTHANAWESMGKPCSCAQFIKSRIFYCKSRENPYQVLQVTCAASECAMKSKVRMIKSLSP